MKSNLAQEQDSGKCIKAKKIISFGEYAKPKVGDV